MDCLLKGVAYGRQPFGSVVAVVQQRQGKGLGKLQV